MTQLVVNLADQSHRSFAAPAYYRIRDVLRMTGLSRPTIYRRIAASRFPPPVHLGGRACGWSAAALQAWINDPQGYEAPPSAPTLADVSDPCVGGRLHGGQGATSFTSRPID